MATRKDSSGIHSVIQVQPNLEIWPFVAVVQASQTPTVLTNPLLPDNPIIFVNDAFLELTGYGREETLGRNCRFLSGPETDRDMSAVVRTAIAEARAISAQLLNYRKDGTRFWNQLHISPIFDEHGMLAYFVGYQHDVTQRVEAEQALQRARQELQGRLAERESLILEIHHRVRNNLQTIVGLLNLEARRSDPALRHQLNLITQRVRVLGSIHEQLESFGDWMAIDFGRHLRETCVELEVLFQDAVAIDVDAEPLMCHVQTAVPLGLIASELIAGCMRYVRDTGAAGQAVVKVRFSHLHDQNIIELSVSRSGTSPASGTASEAIHPSDIVDVLAERIGAEIATDEGEGATMKLTVPAGYFAVGKEQTIASGDDHAPA